MTALAKNTERKHLHTHEVSPTPPLGVLTNIHIYVGSICVTTAAGYLRPAITGTGLVAQGVSEFDLDTTGVASGTIKKGVKKGPFVVTNSATDPVTIADIGNDVFLEDDDTIRRVNTGGNTYSRAGKLIGFHDDGRPIVLIGVGLT